MVDLSNVPVFQEEMAPGAYYNLPSSQYFSLTGASKSYGWRLLNSTAYHMRYGEPQGIPPGTADPGTCVHDRWLEQIDRAVESTYKTRSSDGWKKQYEYEKARGNILLTAPDYEKVEGMVYALNCRSDMREFLEDPSTSTEVSIFARDPDRGILLKGRMDMFNPAAGKIADLKTCASAKQSDFEEAVFKYGYHVQAAMYVYMCQLLGFDIRKFGFFCVEKKKPHATNILYLTTDCEVFKQGTELMHTMLDAMRDDINTEEPTTGWPASSLLGVPANFNTQT